MSINYFLICNDCKEKVDAARYRAGGVVGDLGHSTHCLGPFINKHHGHDVEIISEHHDKSRRRYSLWDDFEEWTPENMAELCDRVGFPPIARYRWEGKAHDD